MNNIKSSNNISPSLIKQIESLYKIPEDIERVKGIIIKAQEETNARHIAVAKKIKSPFKLMVKFKIMLKYGIHWSKPFYPFRLIRNVFLSRLYRLLNLNKFVLRGCEFDITFKCNFSCSHCSIARLDESATRKELSPSDYEDIVAQAMKLGATSFGVEGGELFVRKDWDTIIKACRPRYNHIIVTTNGYLFNEENAAKCAELGVDTVNISIDSGIPELHDLFRRKKGSYQRAIKAVELCRKYHMKPVICTVIHKQNLYTRGLVKLLEFGEENKILVHLQFAKAIGNFKGNDSMLDDEDFREFEKLVKPYFYTFVHHDTQISYGGRGCNATKEILQFTPYGDVMHCANMHIYFGNIKEETLAEIRERAIRNTPFGEYRPCFLTLDKDFMNIYYPLIDKKAHITLEEFCSAMESYENKRDKIINSIPNPEKNQSEIQFHSN